MGTKDKPGEFDCYDKAANDEPLFVLLAHDPDGADTVEDWARRRFRRLVKGDADRLSNEDLTREMRRIAEALSCATAMREWKPTPKPLLVFPTTTRFPYSDYERNLRGMGE